MKNIFVFPCGSEIGLDIYSSLRYSRFFHLIGGSSVSDHGKFVYNDYVGDIPFITDKSCIPFLKELVTERNIDAIYPTMDSAIVVLKENEQQLGCKIVTSPLATTRQCLDKSVTYEILQSTGLVPDVYSFPTKVSFPFFVKPKVGYGSRGTLLISSPDEIQKIEGIDEEAYLFLEYLPGEEYTVDCFTDRHGCLKYSAARRRGRIRSGISVNTSFVDDQTDFQRIAKHINSLMIFRGAWFFQLKRDAKGELKLLEVAARFGGSSLLSKGIGVNLPLLSLFDAFDEDVSVSPNQYSIVLDRALGNSYFVDIHFDTVYLDFDDCLLINENTINLELVQFLFSCINRNIPIILLTKHKGNLEEKLREFRLESLFDDVIHISDCEKKFHFVRGKYPIFIDDSYAERKEIQDKLGIPVFSPDMIEVLL